ncbi:MAG: hypothetical protein DME65_03905 [Verrucomicrobia bacterium]|nr:MAG: hypothetical protein DME65_03905 [Verrucomicrobiota bacterium]
MRLSRAFLGDKAGVGADGTRQTPDLSVQLCWLSFTSSRFVFYSVLALSCRGSASPSTGSNATLGDGWQRACQRSPSSYDDGAADGTVGLAGIEVQASVQGEAASSTSVPARSANNGIGFHKVKIAVGA